MKKFAPIPLQQTLQVKKIYCGRAKTEGWSKNVDKMLKNNCLPSIVFYVTIRITLQWSVIINAKDAGNLPILIKIIGLKKKTNLIWLEILCFIAGVNITNFAIRTW